jgi:predicted metal-binding membrane protein
MRAGVFALGYLAVWTAFSLAAAALQWALDQVAMLSSDMAITSAVVAGAIVAVAGLYQWTPLKRTCLTHCRSPIDAITHYWRAGVFGAFSAGVRHGLYCLGCCVVLMALLFAGGIMNLAWIAGIAVLVLIEKVTPWGEALSRIVGVMLLIWGGTAIVLAISI